MRVLYDGLIYATQRAGGINRYFANVISRLPAGDSAVLTTPYEREVNFPAHPKLDVHVASPRGPRGLDLATRPVRLRRAERGFDHDLLHPTYYVLQTGRALRRVRVPVVLTVWDLTHVFFKRELDRHGIHAHLMRRAVSAADAVLCISENTRVDLLEHFRVAEDKVRVIPLATDMDASIITGSEQVPDYPYVLYVGSRANYKNFDLALRALAAIGDTQPDARLVVVGSSFNDSERARMTELGVLDRVEEAGVADDARVAALYARSRALVYPSRYEGFGIPPLEAMACGTVAITSNTSSIPEVVGDAALTFDPDSLEQLVEHLRSVLDDDSLRSELIARGAEQVRTFSWDRTARETFDVYHELVP